MKKNPSTDSILVSPACFRQRVNLPLSQVSGLTDEELASALAFEIEPFSGIPHAEGEMAWRVRSDAESTRRVFDVVQIRRTDLSAAVREARDGKKRVSAVTAAPETSLGEKLEDMPLIPVRAQSAFAAHPLAIWIAACAIAAIVLGIDYLKINGDVRRLRTEVAERRVLQAQKGRLESQASALRREASELRQRRADEARAQDNAAMLRSAWRVMLAALPSACRDESVVRSIRPQQSDNDGFTAEVSGVSLSAEAAGRTLLRLTDALASPKSAWKVTPGSLGAQTSGGTVGFSCSLAFDPNGAFK